MARLLFVVGQASRRLGKFVGETCEVIEASL